MTVEIRAEIVGNVMRVDAREGARIASGDAILMLESMKMEIPVLSEAAGQITRVMVAEGDLVHEGDILAVLD